MNQNRMTATELLQGSRNMDRMMHEVKHCVKIVLGYVNRNHNIASRGAYHEVFTNNHGEWRVSSLHNEYGLCAEYWVRGIAGAQVISPVYSSREGGVQLRAENVQRVHESLDVFLNGMRFSVPGLSESLQPLFDASRVKFD
jgi:hypothetical protein